MIAANWVRLDKPLGLVIIQAKCGYCGKEQTWTGENPRRCPPFEHCGQTEAVPADYARPANLTDLNSLKSDGGAYNDFRQPQTGKVSFIRRILTDIFSDPSWQHDRR